MGENLVHRIALLPYKWINQSWRDQLFGCYSFDIRINQSLKKTAYEHLVINTSGAELHSWNNFSNGRTIGTEWGPMELCGMEVFFGPCSLQTKLTTFPEFQRAVSNSCCSRKLRYQGNISCRDRHNKGEKQQVSNRGRRD